MSIFKVILFPLSLVFGVIVFLRNFLYDLGFLKVTKVSVPVVSVGNITVGGSGKTPYILKLVEELKVNGKRPAVIYRGYKRTSDQPIEKVVLGSQSASHFGDEATLVAFKTEVPVYVGVKRSEVAKTVVENEAIDLILLDDGFQHRAIHRDLDIVLLDATDRRSSYVMLPTGRAREPLASLKRAQLVALHKINLQPKQQVVVETDIQSSIIFKGLVLLSNWKKNQMSFISLPASDVTIVCGVAKPDQVVRTFNKEYPNVSYKLNSFSDHHLFTKDDLPDGVLVVTEKDAIKLIDLEINETQVYVMVTGLDWNLKYETLASKIFTSNK